MITSFLKFFHISERSIAPIRKTLVASNSAHLVMTNNSHDGLSDLLLLNYLPKMDEFGKLYYGLMLVTIGAALYWRLYLNYYRQSLKYRRHHPLCSPNGQRLFDAKCELIEFFMFGPQELPSLANAQVGQDCKWVDRDGLRWDMSSFPAALQRRGRSRALATMDQLISARLCAENLASKFHKPATDPIELPKQENLLARLHVRKLQTKSSRPYERESTCGFDTRRLIEGSTLHQVYRVPIRSTDFLRDKSASRWNYLAKQVHIFSFFLLISSIPLFYYTIVGLNAVRSQFHSDNWNKSNESRDKLLNIYGPLEQTYACTQASLFFMATNIFISLFYADLLYKSLPISRELRIISHLYRMEQLSCLPRAEMYRQQLRIWAYFDNILVLDGFISKYSLISMATVIIGLSFGQSYLRVEDMALKAGTAAALISNLLSFTYLHLVSWHIEKRSAPVHKAILCIIARESHHEAKREWQRTLFGFFGPDWRRTFTLGGRYPLNLQSFLKTIFGLATVSLVINRLFHKRAWEASFAHLETGAQNRPPTW